MTNTIIFERYLVVEAKIESRGYLQGNVKARLTTKKPATGSNEIAIKLNLELPKSLFMKQQLAANITISDEQCANIEIDADTVSQIEALATEQLGVDLNITVSNEGGDT